MLLDQVKRARALRARGEGGFTLVEILVVVIIITVISAIAVPIYLGQRGKANDAKMEADLSAVGSLLTEALSTKSPVTFSGSTISTAASTDAGLRTVTVDGVITSADFTSGDVPAGGDCVTITRADESSADYCLPALSASGGGGGGGGGGSTALSLSYTNTAFTSGSNNQVLSPTVSGGSGEKSYTLTDGSLPADVTFDEATGTFTGPVASAWNFTATQISAGGSHSCAVLTDGTAMCWGYNNYGQLGDGTTTDRFTPVDVSGLTSGVASISAGDYHSCALLNDGTVKCWGGNNYGQLGDGSTTNRSTPVDVSGLTSGVASISAGSEHTCAVTTTGGAKCWGRNNYGRLGDGTTTNRSTPVDVSGLTSGVASISAGVQHTCAVTATGGAKCWGWNGSGRLGDGTTTSSNTPVTVSGLSGATGISAGGSHSCAVLSDGTAECWGNNGGGQLGDGDNTYTNRSTPVTVSGLSGATGITSGSEHTCAVLADGIAKCWGWNGSGRLGDGTTTSSNTPVTVSGVSGATGIDAGGSHSCAVLTDGTAMCWGSKGVGQLGAGVGEVEGCDTDEGFVSNATQQQCQNWGGTWTTGQAALGGLTPIAVVKSGPQSGFPASLTVTVTDSSGSTTANPTLSVQ
jgi:prepilin-type N-terminal cleavage/methylation domain-containing protein